MSNTWFAAADFLTSTEPWKYFEEWGENDPEWKVSEEDLNLLKHSLEKMDESHLAFALPIAETHAPAKFAIEAARLLSHPSMSVRINAYRVIRAVPQEDITDDLRAAARWGLEECPERSQFADVLERAEVD